MPTKKTLTLVPEAVYRGTVIKGKKELSEDSFWFPDNLLDLAEAKSIEERVDKSTALRQLMYEGAEQYVLELISDGRLSVSRGAEILDESVHEIYRLARKRNIEIETTDE